ncbi:MAG: MerR family transcriptional regulator [bacterium]
MTNKIEAMSNVYRIGAVSRLTGISTDTLRIWERRYNIVEPQRSEKGGRLYSQEDVSRLTMIKTLVDQGQAISTIAGLSAEDLNQRLRTSSAPATAKPSNVKIDVCVIGKAIAIRASNDEDKPKEIEIVAEYDSIEGFLESTTTCSTLIVELAVLDRDSATLLTGADMRSRAKQIIVVYAFSPSYLLNRLRRFKINSERAPIALDHLWQRCLHQPTQKIDLQSVALDLDKVGTEPIPDRLFTPEQLIVLGNVSTALKCECPHHMSSIIETLAAFEQYSAGCEIETRKDAALHSYLHVMTAKARWIMENALEKLIDVEGIDMEEINSTLSERKR